MRIFKALLFAACIVGVLVSPYKFYTPHNYVWMALVALTMINAYWVMWYAREKEGD